MRRLFFTAFAISAGGFCIFAVELATALKPAASLHPPIKAVPVLAAKAETQDVPIILRGLGTVTAFNSVALRSRVEGAITRVNFREGQVVHAGDLLIQLDPRPYQAALDQAQANLSRDQAALANAKVDLARYADLLKRNFSPEQQFATQKTTVAQNEAATEADQAMIQSARLNVDYAALRSPIDGVTGIRQIDIGNLIQANSAQNLVTITQIQPIYVVFTLPEADIDRVREAMSKGTLTIQAFMADDRKLVAQGKLDLIDNTVDQTTGTVKLKAEFANTDGALWPGQFTYVVEPSSKVKLQPLQVLQTESNRALIGTGLKLGDEVVTAGQFRLQPGTTVQVSRRIADAVQKLSDAPAGTESAN